MYDGKKTSGCVGRKCRRGGESANGCRGVFRYYILPMGKGRKKIGKAKMKGSGKRKLGVKTE